MASKHEKRSSSALDPMMAGFAGGAAAFIIYAMPQAHFDEAVSLSGLPMILSAAQPPLGMTARFAAMAAAGIGSFLLVWLVLRALSKPAPKPKHRSGPVEIEMAPPRLRRADAHPDAPSRRPILAGVDLGRPFDEMPVHEQPFDQFPGGEDQPLDALLADEEQPLDALPADGVQPLDALSADEEQPLDMRAADEEQPWDGSRDYEDGETQELPAQGAPYVDHYVDPYVDRYVDHYQPGQDLQPVRDSFETEPQQADHWSPPLDADIGELGFDGRAAEEEREFAEDDSVAGFERVPAEEEQELSEEDFVASFLAGEESDEEESAEEESAEDEPAGEEPYGDAPLDLSPRDVQTVHALSQRLAEAGDARQGSIPDLMERLEAGLRRRQRNSWPASAPDLHSSNGAAPASGEAPPQVDARLRGAIQELQKLAARGN